MGTLGSSPDSSTSLSSHSSGSDFFLLEFSLRKRKANRKCIGNAQHLYLTSKFCLLTQFLIVEKGLQPADLSLWELMNSEQTAWKPVWGCPRPSG